MALSSVRAQETEIAAPASDVGSNSVYQAIAPCWMVDTRKTTAQGYPPPYGTPAFGAGEQRTFAVTGPIACRR
jgi:hypothetical protein